MIIIPSDMNKFPIFRSQNSETNYYFCWKIWKRNMCAYFIDPVGVLKNVSCRTTTWSLASLIRGRFQPLLPSFVFHCRLRSPHLINFITSATNVKKKIIKIPIVSSGKAHFPAKDTDYITINNNPVRFVKLAGSKIL